MLDSYGRGMATYTNGIPNFAPDFRLIYAGPKGGVAGLYPLDAHRCYYFLGFAASEVGSHPLKDYTCIISHCTVPCTSHLILWLDTAMQPSKVCTVLFSNLC